MPDPVTPAPQATTESAPPPAATPPATPPAATAPAATPEVLGETATPAEPTPSKPGSEGKPAAAAPVEIKLTAPEGVELDSKALEGFTTFAKEMGLTQDQAQKALEFQLSREAEANASAKEFWADQNRKWVEAIKTDKEVGGADWQVKATKARNAAFALGGQELLTEISRLGLANNPALVRAFYRAATKMSEDSLTARPEGSPTRPDDSLRAMFDKSPELFQHEG